MPAKRLLFKRTLVIGLSGIVILAGLLMGGVRIVDHLMPGYRDALAQRIGERIGARVHIDAITLGWRWHGPTLTLRNVSITRRGAAQPAVAMARLGLEFAFSDLIDGERTPDGLDIRAPRIALRLGADDRPDLVHWSRPDDPPLRWRLARQLRERLRRISVDGAVIELQSPHLPGGATTLEDVDVHLQAEGARLRWRVNARGRRALGRIASHGTLTGALPDARTGDFELEITGLDPLAFARANDRLTAGPGKHFNGAAGSLRVRGRVAAHRLAEASVAVELGALEAGDDSPLLPALSATFGVREPDDASGKRPLMFALKRLQGKLPGREKIRITGRIQTQPLAIDLQARHPPSAAVLRVARALVPRLADIEVHSDVDRLHFNAGVGQPLALGVDFANFRIDAPHVSAGPISGRYQRRGARSTLRLTGAGGDLTVDRYLRGALAIDDLSGALSWQRAGNGWNVTVEQLALTSGKARAQASGTLRLRAGAAPKLALKAHAMAPNSAALLAHIPRAEDLPNPRLREWLGAAIGAGDLTSATLVISGPLDRFPFAQPHKGERFRLALAGRGVDVDYKPGWPPLHNARGTLVLDGVDLRVHVASARMLGVKLDAANGHVADVREPILEVDAATRNAPAQRLLAFLVRSPLRDKFAKFVDAVAVSGRADLDVDLRIPLKPGLGAPRVQGKATARGATLRQAALPAPIESITGTLRFDDDGVTGRNLHGRLGDMRLTTDVTPAPGKRERIVTHTALALPRDADIAAHYLPKPWLRYARGDADLRVVFTAARGGGVADINVDSDLDGMALALPAPVVKPAAARASLAVTVADRGQRVQVDYDHRLAVSARLANGKPTRVQAMFNDPTREPPDVDGIWIGGHLPTADGLGWFHVIRTQLAATAQTRDDTHAPLVFRGADLRIARLKLGNRRVANAHIRAQTMRARPGWRINLEGPNTQGQVRWLRTAGGRVDLEGNLAKLALTTDSPPAVNKTSDRDPPPVIWADVAPGALPGLDLNVASVRVDDTDFGHVHVNAHALADGWQLDRLQLADGDLTGSATAKWQRSRGTTRATAATQLAGQGLADLLRTLGYAPTVQAESARVGAQLTIAPNPAGLNLRALDGNVDLALDDGTLLSIRPGATRALGLFNLYALPRRFLLDFRDVVDKGLAFDSLRADFEIENGNAYSNGVRIETPSTSIHMRGRIGLAARDYDQRVRIAPKFGSGVAIASGVLGGPIVGAAVLAVQKLFEKPIQHFSSIAYTLKGSWDDPTIADPEAER